MIPPADKSNGSSSTGFATTLHRAALLLRRRLEELEARAYQLRRDGKKPREIAQALRLKDPCSEAARKRADRLIDLGERLSLRKNARTPKNSGR